MNDSRETDWLEWRRSGIGGSDVAAILSLSPWGSRWSVFADKVGLTDGPDESDAMEFGKRAEPMLAGYFHDRTGLHVAGEQTWCTHPVHEFMRCTVDGFVCETGASTDVNDALGVFEAKTTSEGPDVWEEGIPRHYQAQAAHTCNVTGFDVVWFGVLHLAFGRPTFRVYEYRPDEADRQHVAAEVTRFWHDHVVTGTPPEVDGSPATTNALGAAWPGDDDDVIDVSADLELEELPGIKAEIKRLEARKAEIENEIKAGLGDHHSGTCGRWKLSWKPQDRTSIDTKALRADHPDIALKYASTTTSRVLRITQHKEK